MYRVDNGFTPTSTIRAVPVPAGAFAAHRVRAFALPHIAGHCSSAANNGAPSSGRPAAAWRSDGCCDSSRFAIANYIGGVTNYLRQGRHPLRAAPLLHCCKRRIIAAATIASGDVGMFHRREGCKVATSEEMSATRSSPASGPRSMFQRSSAPAMLNEPYTSHGRGEAVSPVWRCWLRRSLSSSRTRRAVAHQQHGGATGISTQHHSHHPGSEDPQRQ